MDKKIIFTEIRKSKRKLKEKGKGGRERGKRIIKSRNHVQR